MCSICCSQPCLLSHPSTRNHPTDEAGLNTGLRTEGVTSLRRAWESSQRSTKEDWAEWMRNFSIELLKQSPRCLQGVGVVVCGVLVGWLAAGGATPILLPWSPGFAVGGCSRPTCTWLH